jgi:hypothetical protein
MLFDNKSRILSRARASLRRRALHAGPRETDGTSLLESKPTQHLACNVRVNLNEIREVEADHTVRDLVVRYGGALATAPCEARSISTPDCDRPSRRGAPGCPSATDPWQVVDTKNIGQERFEHLRVRGPPGRRHAPRRRHLRPRTAPTVGSSMGRASDAFQNHRPVVRSILPSLMRTLPEPRRAPGRRRSVPREPDARCRHWRDG